MADAPVTSRTALGVSWPAGFDLGIKVVACAPQGHEAEA